MDLRKINVKLLHDVTRYGQKQRGTISLEEPVKATPHTVVVKRRHLRARQPQELRTKLPRPLSDPVDRLTRHEIVLQQHQCPTDRRDRAALGFDHELPEEVRQLHLRDHAIKDRQRSYAVGRESLCSGCGPVAGRVARCPAVLFSSIFHARYHRLMRLRASSVEISAKRLTTATNDANRALRELRHCGSSQVGSRFARGLTCA